MKRVTVPGLIILFLIGIQSFGQTPDRENSPSNSPSSAPLSDNSREQMLWKEVQTHLESLAFQEAHEAPQQPQAAARPNEKKPANPFELHITEAIRLNLARKDVYARLSSGASKKVSNQLIAFERLCLIPAHIIDKWAHHFSSKGIGIIENDFVSMKSVAAPETPSLYRGFLNPAAKARLQESVRSFQKIVFTDIRRGDFMKVAGLTFGMIQVVREAEKRNRCHLALTAHFLESLGFSALHAVAYAKQSKGKTNSLSKAFLILQLLPLRYSLPFDTEAQKIQARGIGIVVNDVPHIPFVKEWQEAQHRDFTLQ